MPPSGARYSYVFSARWPPFTLLSSIRFAHLPRHTSPRGQTLSKSLRQLMYQGLDLAGRDGGFRNGGREISWPMALAVLGGMFFFGAAGAKLHGPWPTRPCWRDGVLGRGGREISWPNVCIYIYIYMYMCIFI